MNGLALMEVFFEADNESLNEKNRVVQKNYFTVITDYQYIILRADRQKFSAPQFATT